MFDVHCWAEEAGIAVDRFDRALVEELEVTLADMTEVEQVRVIKEIDANAEANKACYEAMLKAASGRRR